MTSYTITPRGESTFEAFTVEATSYSEAATKAARKLNGRRAWANRETGHPTMSGIFQGYERIGRTGDHYTSVGGNFHVRAN